MTPRIVRLGLGDAESARRMFALMAEVFGTDHESASDAYLAALLGRPDFWALAALDGGAVLGGLTAHALPMTRAPGRELFLYDLAVRPSHQRRGVGRALLLALRSQGAREGMTTVFVAADDEDTHALDFYRALGGAPSPVTIFTFDGTE
jgi:aminoglycoside 3-N-acetyltransferase I